MRFLLAALSFVGTVSAQQTASDLDRVKPGQSPPSFELPSASGENVTLASLRGKNVVLVFYRGYW